MPWLSGCAMAALTLVAALSLPVPASARAVAAIFPPWWNEEAALVAAGEAGDVLGPGLWRNVMIVRAGDGDLPARLSAAGALVVVDADIVGCGSARGRI